MTAYDKARATYWDAQRAFRDVAVATIAAAIPEGMAYAVFEINDTPRLSLSCYLDADGNEHHDDTAEPWDTIDDIANDTEAYNWDEADSFMPENDTDGRFLIAAEAVAR